MWLQFPKGEAFIRLGLATLAILTCTSQPCLWNQAYSKKVIDKTFDHSGANNFMFCFQVLTGEPRRMVM